MSDYRDPQLNTLIMSGRLSRDGVLKYTKQGKPVLKGAFAHPDGFGDNKVTEFYDFTWFGAMAEKMAERMIKGAAIIIQGRLVMERWEGRDGEAREKPAIIANMIQLNDWPERGEKQQRPQRDEPQDNPIPEDDIPF